MKFTLNKAKTMVVLMSTLAMLPSLTQAQVTNAVYTSTAFAEVAVAAETTPILPVAEDVVEITAPTPEQVKAEIIRQANLYGVSVNNALRIARCESGYVYNAKNGTSTAKGVFQFINGTWKWIGAEGHQFDYKENIKQFMIWYPKYPQWWECK